MAKLPAQPQSSHWPWSSSSYLCSPWAVIIICCFLSNDKVSFPGGELSGCSGVKCCTHLWCRRHEER